MRAKKMSTEQAARRLPGRPREFDRDEALRAAMLVFWQHGYDGASLSMLTEAMGVSKPTLYAAFGDKAGVFREAVAVYTGLKGDKYAAALALPTARAAAEAWLRLTSGVTRLPDTPSGCLLMRGAGMGGTGIAGTALDGELGTGSEALRREVVAILLEATAGLRERFARAQREGDLAPEVDASVLAEYMSALAAGMAMQSACGIGSEVLNRVVDLAMESWPWSREP